MPVSKESTTEVISEVISDKVEEYTPPEAEIIQTEDIDRASMCACKAGDDNPY